MVVGAGRVVVGAGRVVAVVVGAGGRVVAVVAGTFTTVPVPPDEVLPPQAATSTAASTRTAKSGPAVCLGVAAGALVRGRLVRRSRTTRILPS